MSFPFSIFRFSESDEVNLTAFVDGQMYSATDSHPNYERIKELCEAGDESVVELFDLSFTAQRRFERLSERVSITSGRIYFDGEEVDNALTQQVVRFINEGVEDFKPLVLFFEKVQTNPNSHSQEQLYRWLKDRAFTINQDGNIVAYKGVKKVTADHQYESISHGTAMVDGVEHTGGIPNPLGAVVEMPRSEVQHNPAVGCHTGLHAGTWNYASGFAQGAVLTVEINPRDVVSVPTDCQDQKMRVCRYTVTGVTEQELGSYVTDEYDEDEEVEDVELPEETPEPVKYQQVGWLTSVPYPYDDDEEEDDVF
ncbi:RIIB lysis inhibitor [Streptomyces phage Blueeyedbeauty]|uniref:RIIB-like protein n=1 Tax=Streptomyces phage Blueeyedbeauty TaxID=2250336 RepID=A0A345L1X6_9CAUD|nr:RIIB lysis inhibitor [Streptomyces phage Blueeyedbeauty]AXH49278.1 rIIB-like protein [Streptomyces phage Blueeyedbeauty]